MWLSPDTDDTWLCLFFTMSVILSLTPCLTYMFKRSLNHPELFLEGHTHGSTVPYSFSKQFSLTFSRVQFRFLLPCPEILYCSEAKDLVLAELRYTPK